MVNRIIGIKLTVTLALLGVLLVVTHSTGRQARTKKQNMVEMGEQFAALNQRMMGGAITAKFSDQDFQQIETYCETLVRLCNEYAELETDKNLDQIATSLTAGVNYLKQQVAGKDGLVAVVSYGQMMSYCAECHYQTRWHASPGKP